jgi:hypothetical protein
VLLAFTSIGLFSQRWCSLPMKTLRGRQYSFKMLTQFKLLNKVLDPLACYINGSLPRGTDLLSFTWERLFFRKIMLLSVEEPERLSLFLTLALLNNMPEPLASNNNNCQLCFLHSIQDMQCFFHSIQWGCLHKGDDPPHENTER